MPDLHAKFTTTPNIRGLEVTLDVAAMLHLLVYSYKLKRDNFNMDNVYSSTQTHRHTHRWHCSWLLQRNAAVWIRHGPLPSGSLHQPACDCRETHTHTHNIKVNGLDRYSMVYSLVPQASQQLDNTSLGIFVALQSLKKIRIGIKLTWQSVRVLPQCPPASLGRWDHWHLRVSDTPHPVIGGQKEQQSAIFLQKQKICIAVNLFKFIKQMIPVFASQCSSFWEIRLFTDLNL